MDIDRSMFPKALPEVLKHIADAHFIAFDLELSGIPVRQHTSGKATLEDRYAEVKAAANTFHILQVGLTCVEEDATNSRYLVRPYNFNLSPLVPDVLGIDRSFTYHASAVNFLLSNGYDMNAPFSKGVPYLTRDETMKARENMLKKFDSDSIPDVYVPPGNTKIPQFMARVRRDLLEWLETRPPDLHHFDITNPNPANSAFPIPLDRLERRLVHQIVRSDFPKLQTTSRAGGVRVILRNQKLLDEAKANTAKRISKEVSDQVGFRWVAEAMASNDVSPALDTDPEQRPASNPQKKVLLGHNCFMDLIFFYQLFYGTLPDRLEDFIHALHQVFPVVIDTKYMATEGDEGEKYRRHALGELERTFSTLDTSPSMLTPAGHFNGQEKAGERYHEAGFDSLVTAKLFLRLATRTDASKPSQAPASPPPQREPVKQSEPRRRAEPNKQDSRFSHSNPYDTLTDSDMEAAAVEAEGVSGLAEKPASSSDATMSRDTEEDMQALGKGLAKLEVGGSGRMMPRWHDAFWAPFTNRLRVYGTIEEECLLAPPRPKDGIRTTSQERQGVPPQATDEARKPAEESATDAKSTPSDGGGVTRRTSLFARVKKTLNVFE